MIKILFISRAYPPVVGGIENQNYELHNWLAKIAEVKSIINKKGKLFLPFFIPYAIWKSLFLLSRCDAILLGDGVLAFVGWKLKFLTKKPVICVVHGLDLTYKNKIYQWLWVGHFLKRMDKLIAVGQETIKIGIAKGIAQDKFAFIPNGVDVEKYRGNYNQEDLQKIMKSNLGGKKVILTSGRLVKRKGVAWFITEVMPKLNENILYVVAGDGPDFKNISQAISERKLNDRVEMLGYVTDKVRDILFNTADLFVQPNIKIAEDVEGFGISVLEAGCCGLPVIAASIEGLKDAIQDEKNGFLVESENTRAWVQKIIEVLKDDNQRKLFGEKARQYIMENYHWKIISQRYLKEIEKTINQ